MKIPRDCARVLALAPVEQKEHSDEVTRVTKDLRNDGSYLHLLNLLQRVWGLAVRVFDRCVRASCAVAPTVCGVLDVDRFLRSALNPKKIKEMLLYGSRKIDALTILASKHCPRTPRPVGFLKKSPMDLDYSCWWRYEILTVSFVRVLSSMLCQGDGCQNDLRKTIN